MPAKRHINFSTKLSDEEHKLFTEASAKYRLHKAHMLRMGTRIFIAMFHHYSMGNLFNQDMFDEFISKQEKGK